MAAGIVNHFFSRTHIRGQLDDDAAPEEDNVLLIGGETILGKAIARENFEWSNTQRGFYIQSSLPLSVSDLRSGRVCFVTEKSREPLVIHEPALDALAGLEMIDLALSLDHEALDRLFNRIVGARAERTGQLSVPDEIVSLSLPLGLKSPGNTAIIGRQGHIFLLEGTNDLIEQHRIDPDSPEVAESAHSWASIFVQRADKLAQRGISYLQLVIPDKSSLVPEAFPEPITAPTPRLSCLDQMMSDREWYLSGYSVLSGRHDALRLTDCHLSATGALLVVRAMLARLGLPQPEVPEFRIEITTGDVAQMYAPAVFFERIPRLLVEQLSPNLQKAEIAREHRPTFGHVGTRVSWRNEAAPIGKRVLMFGNSYCGIGESAETLSWHLGRYFQQYEFCWSPEIDLDLVDEIQPDIVIAQTVERFLLRVPKN